MNAILGVYQENKAEEAIEALRQMTAATSKVIRDGVLRVVKSEDVTVGDVLILEAGDSVPADARIIESASMKVEESALTGESVPSAKTADVLRAGENGDVPLGDRANMVYMGSTVVYGRGKAIVTAVGMDTEMGRIADALTAAEEGKTPLQMKLAELSKILTFLVIGISVVIFAVTAIKDGNFITDIKNGQFKPIVDTLMIAVSLAVAAVYDGATCEATLTYGGNKIGTQPFTATGTISWNNVAAAADGAGFLPPSWGCTDLESGAGHSPGTLRSRSCLLC